MRVLHAIHSIDPAGGGPAEVIRQFGSVSTAEGHAVEVVSLDAAEASYVSEFPLPVHAMGPGKGKYGYTPKLLPWLKKRHSEYDAVVVDGLWQYNGLAVWRAFRDSATPYFVFTHGMLDPWFKRQYPLKHLKKLPYWSLWERRILRDAKAVLYTCEEERLLAHESFGPFAAKEKIVHLGTAVPAGNPELQRGVFLSTYPGLRGKRIVLFLGRLHPKKGCDLLLRAFARVFKEDDSWRLVVAGPDQVGWLRSLQHLAGELNVSERVIWTGMLQDAAKWGAYRAAEVFALPSHQENFGIAVAEALACGLPALLSKRVNIWREVTDDGAGFAAEDDLEGCIKLLQRWKQLDSNARASTRAAAFECFERRFQIRAAVHSFISTLQEGTGSRLPEVVHA